MISLLHLWPKICRHEKRKLPNEPYWNTVWAIGNHRALSLFSSTARVERVLQSVYCKAHSVAFVLYSRPTAVFQWVFIKQLPFSVSTDLWPEVKKWKLKITQRTKTEDFCLRPYHAECSRSRSISEDKLRRARLVLRWVTAWEHRVLQAFYFTYTGVGKGNTLTLRWDGQRKTMHEIVGHILWSNDESYDNWHSKTTRYHVVRLLCSFCYFLFVLSIDWLIDWLIDCFWLVLLDWLIDWYRVFLSKCKINIVPEHDAR